MFLKNKMATLVTTRFWNPARDAGIHGG